MRNILQPINHFAYARRGFTLIEMLVVIAIIAILAMIALPSGQDKLIRTQIAEALPLADIAKTPIATAWASTHNFLPDNASAGLPVSDKVVNNFVRAVSVKNGVIDITFGNRAHPLIKDKTLSLRPAVIDDAPVVPITWVCGYANPPEKMTVHGENHTDVPVNYLPLACRG
jgi:type IV pilus assembly protein PilA